MRQKFLQNQVPELVVPALRQEIELIENETPGFEAGVDVQPRPKAGEGTLPSALTPQVAYRADFRFEAIGLGQGIIGPIQLLPRLEGAFFQLMQFHRHWGSTALRRHF
jgi:hypothetical protein